MVQGVLGIYTEWETLQSPECRLQQTKLKNDDMGNWEPTQKHILESFYQVHPVNLKL